MDSWDSPDDDSVAAAVSSGWISGDGGERLRYGWFQSCPAESESSGQESILVAGGESSSSPR